MTKKLILMFVVALIAALVYTSFASASIGPDYYPNDPEMFITSANQYYSVVYDGEGEALVSMRVDINNRDSSPLTEVLVELPYSNVHLYSVVENIPSGFQQECVRYSQGCLEYGSGSTCVSYDINGECISYETPCLKTGSVCQEYRTTGRAESGYTKLDVSPSQLADSVSLPIKFSAPILKDQSRTVLLMYKISGIAKSRAGVFNFEFDTARLPLLTKSVRVASNVQSGMILKGMKSDINYKSDFSVLEDSMLKMSAGATNDMVYNSYSNSISRARGLTESASYLDPHESLVVKGKYASSWWTMYWDNVLLTILIIAVVLFGIVFAVKKMRFHVKKDKKVVKEEDHSSFTKPFLSGLYTSLGLLGVWLLTFAIISLGNGLLRRSDLWDVLAPLFFIIALVVSIALLIGVPVHMSKNFGGSVGLYTLLSIFGWLFVFSIIAFIIAAVVSSGSIIYY